MSSTSDGLLFQKALYAGLNLENILYGIQLTLYFKTMHCLLSHAGERTKSDIFYATFSSVMLSMSTIWVTAQATFCGRIWLLEADFPGGAVAYWETNIGVWYMTMATAAAVVLQLMTDGLMIYRCWAVWNDNRVIMASLTLWSVTLVLGALVCWTSSTYTGGFFFQHVVVQLGLAYYSVSVFLTVVLTWGICYRILRHGRLIKAHLRHEYASPYFAVVVLVVESILPYSLSGIVFLVSLGVGSQTMGVLFAYVHILLMCVSPQMLILRVAMGTAWGKGVDSSPSAIEFSPEESVVDSCVPKCAEA